MFRLESLRLKSLLMTAALLGSVLGFACGPVSAQVAPVAPAVPVAQQSPEQRVALVIGNSNYRNAPRLANPDNDAQSMAQFLNSAGFEVISATDLAAAGNDINSETFASFETYIVVTAMYLVMSTILSALFAAIQRMAFRYPPGR